MSKAEIPTEGNFRAQVSEANYPQHLATTERGLAMARAALVEAHAKAIEAEEAHRLNLERALAAEKAAIRALRVEMYGAKKALDMAEIEARESDIWAAAEEILEGPPDTSGEAIEGPPNA
jgi:hypothetical protein